MNEADLDEPIIISMEHYLVPAKLVNGADVCNQAHTKIGKIEDIAIDKRTGKVAYAILSFGGFLGLGEKYQPLPWSVLTYSEEDDGYVVPITEEFLALAPKLDVSELSGWDDTEGRKALLVSTLCHINERDICRL